MDERLDNIEQQNIPEDIYFKKVFSLYELERANIGLLKNNCSGEFDFDATDLPFTDNIFW